MIYQNNEAPKPPNSGGARMTALKDIIAVRQSPNFEDGGLDRFV